MNAPRADPARTPGSAGRATHDVQPVHDARGRPGARGRRSARATHVRCTDGGSARGIGGRRGRGGSMVSRVGAGRRSIGRGPHGAGRRGGDGLRRDAPGAPRSPRSPDPSSTPGPWRCARGIFPPGCRPTGRAMRIASSRSTSTGCPRHSNGSRTTWTTSYAVRRSGCARRRTPPWSLLYEVAASINRLDSIDEILRVSQGR